VPAALSGGVAGARWVPPPLPLDAPERIHPTPHVHADFELEPPTVTPHAGPPSSALDEPPSAVSVLLVDDRPENLLALEALLEPLGVGTVRATSGTAAIERARETEFAVILLDVMMPGMDGFDTALAIRDLPGAAVSTPIIFLTAANMETRAWTARSYALGAADYLTKPVDADALRSKVTVFVELARARREVERAAAMREEYARAQAARVAAERHASQLAALNERLQQQARELAAQSAAALRASEETRALAESMPQLVWAAQPNGVVDYYNERWYAYTGMPRRGAPDGGDGWSAVLHPDDRAAVREAWGRAVATGDPYETTARFRAAATGEYRWFLVVRALPARDEAGRVARWFGTCTDVEDQQRAQRGLRFLAEASAALASSLEYETTLATVARLAVPALADWCAVDMVDHSGGRFVRLAVEHPDPAMVALAKELDARYPDDPNARQGRHNVRRTGRSEYMAEIPDALLAASARDAEHLAIIRRLGLRSYMTVPLLGRDGRVLGVITFVSAESGRRYGPADLALAEDLARRAATAIENAALVRELSESRELLEQQATELEMQAEELRESHEELEVSNEELRQTNDELEEARAEAERANRAKASSSPR
jgi:PAS domain S-box-containing protein